MDHSGPEAVVVRAIDLERGMRCDDRPVEVAARRGNRSPLFAVAVPCRYEGPRPVLIGADKGAHGTATRSGLDIDNIDLRDRQGHVDRGFDREGQGSARTCLIRVTVVVYEILVGVGHSSL